MDAQHLRTRLQTIARTYPTPGVNTAVSDALALLDQRDREIAEWKAVLLSLLAAYGSPCPNEDQWRRMCEHAKEMRQALQPHEDREDE